MNSAQPSNTGRFELMTRESDWDSLVAFDRRCYPAEWCVDVQWYHESYEKGYISWLMLVDEKIAGNFQLRDHDSNSRYVSGIAVLPEYQGRGLGKQLLAKLLELYGDSEIVTRIHETNLRSRNLFESGGFVWTHQQQDEKGTWNWCKRLGTAQHSNPADSEVPLL